MLVIALFVTFGTQIIVFTLTAVVAITHYGLTLTLITDVVFMNGKSMIDFIHKLIFAALSSAFVGHPSHIIKRLSIEFDTC